MCTARWWLDFLPQIRGRPPESLLTSEELEKLCIFQESQRLFFNCEGSYVDLLDLNRVGWGGGGSPDMDMAAAVLGEVRHLTEDECCNTKSDLFVNLHFHLK